MLNPDNLWVDIFVWIFETGCGVWKTREICATRRKEWTCRDAPQQREHNRQKKTSECLWQSERLCCTLLNAFLLFVRQVVFFCCNADMKPDRIVHQTEALCHRRTQMEQNTKISQIYLQGDTDLNWNLCGWYLWDREACLLRDRHEAQIAYQMEDSTCPDIWTSSPCCSQIWKHESDTYF